jgi:hypothetical protein
MKKTQILLLSILGFITPLMIGCPRDEEICLQVLNNSASNFVIKIEDCKTHQAMPVSFIRFDRNSEIEPLWMITSDNSEQWGTRFLPTLTYGKLPKQFKLQREPHRLMKGDRLGISMGASYYHEQKQGFLGVTVESD